MTTSASSATNDNERRVQYLRRVSVFYLVATTFIQPYYVYLAVTTDIWQTYAFMGLTLIVTIANLAAYLLLRRGQMNLAAWLIIGNLFLVIPAAPTVVSGLGMAFSVLAILGTVMVSGQALPSKQANRAIVISVAVSLTTLFIDQLEFSSRLILPQLAVFAQVVTVLFVVTFGYFAVRDFRDYSMRSKLIITLTTVAALAIAAVSVMAYRSWQNAFSQQVDDNFRGQAENIGLFVDDFLNKHITQIFALTIENDLRDAVTARNESYIGTDADILSHIQMLDAQWLAADDNDPLITQITADAPVFNSVSRFLVDYIELIPEHSEIIVTDRYGAAVAATGRVSHYYQADESWWQSAWNDGRGRIYLSDPFFDESTGTTAVIIAVPIHVETSDEVIGIVRSTMKLDGLFAGIDAAAFGESGRVMLFDRNAALVYEPASFAEEESAADLPLSLRQHFLEAEFHFEIAADVNGDESIFAHMPVALAVEDVPDQNELSRDIRAAIAGKGWLVVLQQEGHEAFSPITRFAQNVQLVGAIVLLLAGIGAVLVAHVIAQPLAVLADTVQSITAGNLEVTLPPAPGDEIGTLSRNFAVMVAQLRDLIDSLEQRVARRTRALEASAEVSRRLSTILDTSELVREVVQQIQDTFDYYHVHIYLLDGAGENLLMVGGTGEAGEIMLSQGHKLAVGRGLVGKAAVTNKPVLVPDVSKETNWLPNPLLPNTKAEAAIPIASGEQVLGVLDVQHNIVDGLSTESVALLQSIANQAAIALQNARQYSEIQRSQQAFRQRGTLLRTIIDSTLDWVFVKDVNHRYLLVNQSYANSFRMTPDDFIGKNDLDIGFPEDIVKGNPEKGIRGFWADDREIMERGELKVIDVEPAVVDGEERFLNTLKAPLKDADDNVIGVVGFVHDITERMQAEVVLRQSEEKFHTLFEQSADAYLILEGNIFTDCNQATVDMLRAASKKEVLSLHPSKLSPERQPDGSLSAEKADEMIQMAIKKGNHRFEWIHRRADGEDFPVEIMLTAIRLDGKEAVFTVWRDITVRKQAQSIIAKRAAELQTVAEMSTAVAVTQDVAQLLQETADLTKERFQLYHAHIYLLSTQRDVLVLTAGAGAVGRQMVVEHRQIALNQERSLVAQAARTRQGVIENDVRGNPAFLPHPLLPNTRAEMAVPMIVGGQVIGVLDVQSDVVDRFTEQDVMIQTTLAAQIGVALENARSFEKAQTAVTNLNELTRRLTREGWKAYLSEMADTHIGYVYDKTEMHSRISVLETASNGKVALNGSAVPADTNRPSYFIKPINVHGESIGQLSIAPDVDDKTFDDESADIIQAVTEQLSGHIENLRLTEQSQAALFQTEQQAQRLSMLNEMGAELSRADVLDEINEIGVAHTAAILEADQVTLGILAPSREHLEFVAAWGSDEHVQIGVVVPVETNEAIKTAVHQNHVVFSRHNEQSQSDGLESFMTAPLMGDNRVIGVINVGSVHRNHFSKQEESLILQISSLLGAAVERQRLAELTRAALDETQRRSEELALINRVMSAVTGSLNLFENLKIVARELVQAISVSHVSIALMGEDQKELEIVTEYPLSDEDNRLGQKLPIKGFLLTEQALETRKFAVAYDAQNNPLTVPFHDILRERNVHTSTMLPMAIGDEVYGTVGFDILDPDRIITDEQMRLAETIVYHTATIVQNARLFTQTEQRLADLTVIQESLAELTEAQTIPAAVDAFLPRVLSAVDADSTLLFLFDNDKMIRIGHLPLLAGMVEEQTRMLPIKMYPLIGEIIKNRSIFYVQKDDSRLSASMKKQFAAVGIVASAFVPLVGSSGVIGVMLVNLHHVEKELTQHDTALLLTLSNQMSITMERIRLLEATRQRAEREQVLRGIAAKVRNTTQVDSVMRTAVQEIGRALGRKTFLYFDPETKEKE
ncbi:MAG: GAF domain-containing protein [Anaerolineales bacterium]|nr:GAF domain-containing protein [Anaerolineales bacterium]